MFEWIVVAYDGSDPARAAARLAFMIAHPCGAHVLVVHAVELPSGLPAHAELLESFERTLEEQDRAWTRRLQALEELAPAGTRVSPMVAHGRPAGALLDVARAANADLASRERTAWAASSRSWEACRTSSSNTRHARCCSSATICPPKAG